MPAAGEFLTLPGPVCSPDFASCAIRIQSAGWSGGTVSTNERGGLLRDSSFKGRNLRSPILM